MFKKTAIVLGTMVAVLMTVGVGLAATPTTTSTTSTPSTSMSPTTSLPGSGVAETIVYEVGDAGTVTISSDGSMLSIVDIETAVGWTAEIEVAVGREVEADFRNSTLRIQFNAELEDGEIRVRVRERTDDGNGDDMESTTTTSIPSSTTTSTAPSDSHGTFSATFNAGAAGTVVIASDGSNLTIVSVNTVPGWSTEVEVLSGREVELDFRNDGRRIQFKAELEDGEIRIRVRDRLVDDGGHDDHSGHGNSPDDDDDNSDDDK